MRVYTELNLGKTDPGLREPEVPFDIATTREKAALVEELGYDGMVATETKDDSLLLTALAASATTRLNIATSVAIAFARTPYVTAMAARRIQELSAGRFTLGLGTQVRGHLIRRFGLEYSAPGPWMRDYVGAVRALWATWQDGTPLDYDSKRYKLNLMVPLFDAGPSSYPNPPIHLAALNPYMCRVAGEVADGLRPHPVCTPRYIDEVMRPAYEEGLRIAGRGDVAPYIAMKPLVASGRDEEALEKKIRDVRARVAFYASTPAYRPAFEIWGLGDLADKLSVLSREQRWEEMPAYVDDEMLNTYAVVGTYDQIADKIVDRFGGVLSDVGFSIAVENDEDAATTREILDRVRSASS
ncbi:TIGR03617 family F420-dependent LLM class oxidoreductase [Epidermidibacterium keratini]|uniref:TIGR03617 family F420-dependent LLM class oxidoreductase n=1 Tax=Epidermidibacterium keratini TaxID=1891644 RepID=A0A7L4YQ68_9ACTN|nr:TIGR03617 family F420-dependent LLM class oxidoreductase [Epidermidibacterium keratini]QHC01024.1 TIGR03617 family F420-dependent LLM class oxidoreductase [Epidermidibacterium keratini]